MSLPEQDNALFSPELLREMKNLNRYGYRLIPLGREDGKTPRIGNWSKVDVKFSQCLAIMNRTASCSYGVRLDGLIVLDVDTQDPDLIVQLEERFGPAQVKVRSPRGMHLYYAAGGAIPALKAEGLPVDVKTGPNAFMVGPFSVRPDGGCYTYVEGRLGETVLIPLKMFDAAGKVRATGHRKRPEVGSRHNWLRTEALKMVEFVDTRDELTGNLLALRDSFPDPDSMLNSEVRGIADWVWGLRLRNEVYAGQKSAAKLDRSAVEALRMMPDALSLYIVLVSAHGHSPGKRFALVQPRMVQAGVIGLSRDRFRAARNILLQVGLLKKVANHCAGRQSLQFVLCRLAPSGADTSNVLAMYSGQDQKR